MLVVGMLEPDGQLFDSTSSDPLPAQCISEPAPFPFILSFSIAWGELRGVVSSDPLAQTSDEDRGGTDAQPLRFCSICGFPEDLSQCQILMVPSSAPVQMDVKSLAHHVAHVTSPSCPGSIHGAVGLLMSQI